jgi:hypothetical protein
MLYLYSKEKKLYAEYFEFEHVLHIIIFYSVQK